MKIYEFDTLPGSLGQRMDGMPSGMYDASQDDINTAHITDTRKDKLTLRDLNKLKKLRAFRRLEALKREDIISAIYSDPVEEGEGGLDF